MAEKQLDEKYCSSCGEAIKKEAEICPKCGVRAKLAKSSKEKSPGIAAVLSFLWPGLGQIYNGQFGKGIAFIILSAIAAVLIFVLIGCLLYPAIWIYGMYDAYHEAEKINESI